MSNYSQHMKRQLEAYKLERLGVKESGTFLFRGREITRAHILPPALAWLNILETIRREVQSYPRGHPPIVLHEYFHHLNSSQAFALNLFFPFFEAGVGEVLLEAMGLPADCAGWEFEHIADTREGTNADVSWLTTTGVRTYCEVKLTEQKFGQATDDARHRTKLTEIYRPVLAGVVAAELLEPAPFFANYQILRNIWLAARSERDAVVFLLPRANAGLWSQLDPVLSQLSPQMGSRVHVVAVEDVLDALTQSQRMPARLASLLVSLREKYLLVPTPN